MDESPGPAPDTESAPGPVAEPRWAPGGVRWARIELGAGEGALVVAGPGPDGAAGELVVPGEGGCVRPHVTGGGAYAWVDDARLVVVRRSGHLVVASRAGGDARVLTHEGRAGGPVVDPARTRVAFTLDRGDTQDVYVMGLDEVTPPRRVSSGADFTWDPAWSPDGTRLVWHEWDLPAMPWDSSRIVGRTLDGTDPVGPVVDLAGGPETAVAQPRYSPDGRHLAWVSDRHGRLRVWIGRPDGTEARLLVDEPFEHGLPSWGPGARTYVWSPDGRSIAYCRNREGFGELVVVPVGVDAGDDGDGVGEPKTIGRGWHFGLDWAAGGILAVRSGARTPVQIVHTDPATGERDVVAPGLAVGVDRESLVEPTVVAWPAIDGTEIRGLLFRPSGSRGPGALVVDLHGGPTSAAIVDWQPTVAHLVAHGYSVLRPNPRGSTGRGRAYVTAMDGGWGEVDVTDVIAGIRRLVDDGIANPRRVALTGGSAGGFSALLIAARAPDLVAAVVATYAVVDLETFAATTHRFESRYLDRLIGPLPAAAALYRERSPIAHAASITAPVLALHGDADAVVPIDQADRLVAALRGNGGVVEYQVYPGEGHGFSSPAVVADARARTTAFLDAHLGAAGSD